MGALDGRTAIITGAGRGLGRAHALYFAAEGANVVVNDLDPGPAGEVVADIQAAGGRAIASSDDVADWTGAQRIVETAVDGFGALHVLINNAGFIRDRALVNMSEEEWDSVIHVHLKGTFAPTRWAAAYWRAQSKAGAPMRACVLNMSSTSGLLGNPGQSNYGAAKAGVAAFTQIAAMELSRYGVRVNALAPAARTRLTETVPGLGDVVQPPSEEGAFDVWDPANVSPLVAWLSTERCTVTGQMLYIQGGKIQFFEPWSLGSAVEKNGRWTLDELESQMPKLTG
jgi:NAD(P)-dependent dehydrogenase (short-subunit alcohol dehydrogenase family)